MWIISTEESFSAAHKLRGYKGKCSSLHGHNYKARVSVSINKLNKLGVGIDFRELKSILKETIGMLEHKNLNRIFKKENPSAENISKYIYKQIKNKLPQGIKISKVEVWETDTNSVIYTDETQLP